MHWILNHLFISCYYWIGKWLHFDSFAIIKSGQSFMFLTPKVRSCRPKMFYKKTVVKNSAKIYFIKKRLRAVLFLSILQNDVPTPQSRLLPENCLSVFDHFMRLVLKGCLNVLLIRCYWKKWITNGQRDWCQIITSSAKGEYPKNLPKPIPGQTFTGLSDLTQRK